MTRKVFSAVIVVFFFSGVAAQFSVRIQVTGYLNNKDFRTDTVFIAGSFNSWNPGDTNYRMSGRPNGVQYADFKLFKGTYEYKVTRGRWNKVECKSNGSD